MTDRHTRPAAKAAALGRQDATPALIRLVGALLRHLEEGQLLVVLPDGSDHVFGGARNTELRALIHIRRPRAIARILFGGDSGFAESYVDGDWDTPDLTALFLLAMHNEAALQKVTNGSAIARWIDRTVHRLRPNSRAGSRRNIASHYDLGNVFYGLWLDPGMTYSSALFTAADESLETAQDAKYRRLFRTLGLGADHHLLEIGCGWGRCAIIAAEEIGCRVTAITLSRRQYEHARDQVRRRGLDDRVEVRLQDYRDLTGTYDRIVSIEMFEAVGEAFWPTYFDVIRRCLKPLGRAGLQAITIDGRRFDAYRVRTDFIQKHIFPGGMLPSPSALGDQIARAGLRISDWFTFGTSYARTLAAWSKAFHSAWPEIERLGFDPRFRRLWECYLAYCEAGFRSGSIDVAQLCIQRD